MSIIKYPNKFLNIVCKPVELPLQREVLRKIKMMQVELYTEANGMALAAPQVGWDARVFIIDCKINGKRVKQVFINPEILFHGHETTFMVEGCLSFPGIFKTICRSENLGMQFYDIDGQQKQANVDGLLARIILHEYDHLDGKLFNRFNKDGTLT